MLTHAFLAVTTAAAHNTQPTDGLIPLTINEIRRLFTGLVEPPSGFYEANILA
ncbi:hypothetical protein AB1484_30685 [Parafrankia sp. FMc6]|uniref:hypothetical protein n=1 Tax=Parafrankia soli TaxID=2599596 RepID=UPI0034D70C83